MQRSVGIMYGMQFENIIVVCYTAYFKLKHGYTSVGYCTFSYK